MTRDAIIEQILDAFASCGHLDYGEHINMQEHMLQTACFAEQNGEDDRVVVAALLHDYGHLVCNMPNNLFSKGGNNFHEEIGAEALKQWFDKDIVAAVRLHVDAKRYLCATNPDYVKKLSDASTTTLAIQGGPMSEREAAEFRKKNGHEMAIRVRVYDDMGKLPEMKRPGLDYYVPKIRDCLRR